MAYAIMINENEDYTMGRPESFHLWLVKFPCAMALHLLLYPEVFNGLALMKFTNDECDQFVEYGSEISWVLALVQVLIALLGEFVNIFLLLT